MLFSEWDKPLVLLLFLKMLISTKQKMCMLLKDNIYNIDKLYYLFLILALLGRNLVKLILVLAEKFDHTGQGSKINYEVHKGVQLKTFIPYHCII